MKPRNDENRLPTTGVWAAAWAVEAETPAARQALVMALGSVLVRPTIMSEKKMPVESTMPVFMNAAWMPAAPPRWSAGTEFITAAELGAENMPPPMPLAATRSGELPVGEVGRKHEQSEEAQREDHQPDGGDNPCAVAIREVARDRAGREKTDREREQGDARPQRRVGVAVAVQRQPDALEPDDQHELHASAGDGGEQART